MNIRPMDISELDAVLELHVEGLEREIKLFNMIIGGKSVDTEGLPSIRKILTQMYQIDECNIFVAEEDGDYAGYCLATKKVYPIEIPRVTGCINGIYIKEHARRQGLGKKLFDEAVNWLKDGGVDSVELYHQINDERATAFWKSLGFVAVQLNCVKRL